MNKKRIEEKKVSMAVIRRLPKYHRYLKELQDRKTVKVSSKELSEITGFSASQIRQDLNNFGGFGRQGSGYEVDSLLEEITDILGLNEEYNTIVVGAGNLGQAIANYTGFMMPSLKIKALFDINPKLVGIKIRNLDIMDLEEMQDFVERENINLAFICTPKESAQKVANILEKCHIKGIWNFAPIDLNVDSSIMVENVNLSESLFVLSYIMNHSEDVAN